MTLASVIAPGHRARSSRLVAARPSPAGEVGHVYGRGVAEGCPPTRTTPNRGTKRSDRPRLGWREWIALPDWNVAHLKAKIDTGARTSSLHAFDLHTFDRDGAQWARFEIHPWQRSTAGGVVVEAEITAWRPVRSSSGKVDERPVVNTTLAIAGQCVAAEITLTRRDEMGFRMLIGREAIRTRFVVDPGASYRGGRPDKEIRKRNRGVA